MNLESTYPARILLTAVVLVAAASLIGTVGNHAPPRHQQTVVRSASASNSPTPDAPSVDTPAESSPDQLVLDPPTTASDSTPTTTTVPAGLDALRDIVDDMSVEQLARQLVVSGSTGPDMAPTIETSAGSLCIGGIYVKDNEANFDGSSPAAAKEAIGALTEAATGCAVKPLIVTDAEAGSVLRVPVDPIDDPASFIATYVDGGAEEALASLRVATAGLAHDLGELGVNVSLGIVADVDVDAQFYMAGTGRTFGGDPETVAAMVDQMVGAYCDAGVAAALKHFPNQGATPTNPHIGPSISANSIEQWRSFGRIPYGRNRSAPMVMTGHIAYDEVDDGTPASMSRAITTGLLRNEIGFNGVIITDDLHEMAGAKPGGADAPTRAVNAVEAGADLTLWVDPDELEPIIATLARRIDEDPDLRAQVRSSVARILRLKATFGLVRGLDPGDFELCPPGPADFLPPPVN